MTNKKTIKNPLAYLQAYYLGGQVYSCQWVLFVYMQAITKSSVQILSAIKPSCRTRGPLERMALIYSALEQGAKVNASIMARQLEVSTRSILRDVEFMRDRLQLPIEYDQHRFTFVYGGAQ
jgi:hypothetical protein